MAFKELQDATSAESALEIFKDKKQRKDLMTEIVTEGTDAEKAELLKKVAWFLEEETMKSKVKDLFAKQYTDPMTDEERSTAAIAYAHEIWSNDSTGWNFDKMKEEWAHLDDTSQYRQEVKANAWWTTPPTPTPIEEPKPTSPVEEPQPTPPPAEEPPKDTKPIPTPEEPPKDPKPAPKEDPKPVTPEKDNNKPHEVPSNTMAWWSLHYELKEWEEKIGESFTIKKAAFLSRETLEAKGYMKNWIIDFDTMKTKFEKEHPWAIVQMVVPGAQYEAWTRKIIWMAKEHGKEMSHTDNGENYGWLCINADGDITLTHGKEWMQASCDSYVSLPSLWREISGQWQQLSDASLTNTLDGNYTYRKFLAQWPNGYRLITIDKGVIWIEVMKKLREMKITRLLRLDSATPWDGERYHANSTAQSLGNTKNEGFNNVIIFYTGSSGTNNQKEGQIITPEKVTLSLSGSSIVQEDGKYFLQWNWENIKHELVYDQSINSYKYIIPGSDLYFTLSKTGSNFSIISKCTWTVCTPVSYNSYTNLQSAIVQYQQEKANQVTSPKEIEKKENIVNNSEVKEFDDIDLFKQELLSKKEDNIIIIFGATRCGPCKTLKNEISQKITTASKSVWGMYLEYGDIVTNKEINKALYLAYCKRDTAGASARKDILIQYIKDQSPSSILTPSNTREEIINAMSDDTFYLIANSKDSERGFFNNTDFINSLNPMQKKQAQSIQKTRERITNMWLRWMFGATGWWSYPCMAIYNTKTKSISYSTPYETSPFDKGDEIDKVSK